MNILLLYSIYAGTFIAALLVSEAVLISFQRSHSRTHTVNRRMRMISRTGNRGAALSLLKNERHGGLTGILRKALPGFHRSMWLAGISATAAKLIIVMVIAGVMTFAALETLTTLPLPVTIPLTILLSMVLPNIAIRIKARRRMKLFGSQLPPAVDLIVRSLEAGHPVAIALGMVAREMPDPIGTEFGIAVDEMTYGLRMDEALENMVDRFPNADLQFLIMAVQIQRTTGGNLGEILNNLAAIIRARQNMYKKIKAISAEGRASGYVVGFLPFVVGGLIMVVNPGYFVDVSDDFLFIPLIAASFVSLLLGGVMMWSMINIKV